MKTLNNTILFISFSVFGVSDTLVSPLIKTLVFLILIAIFLIINKDKNLPISFFSDKVCTLFTYSYILYFLGSLLSAIFSEYSNILETLEYSGLWLIKLYFLINLSKKVEFYKLIRYFALSISLTSLLTILSNRELIQNLLLIRFIRKFLNIGGSLRNSIIGYHPNQLAGVVGLILIFILFRYLQKFLIIKNFTLSTKTIIIEGFYLFLTIFNFAILVITSSRSVLLSIIISLLLTTFTYLRLDKDNRIRNFFFATIIFTIALQFININSIFLINDKYRGIGTGFTGRSEIFQYFLDLTSYLGLGYLDDPVKYVGLFFHNSYLGILVQSGYVFGSFLIAALLFMTYTLIKLFLHPKLNEEYFSLLLILPYLFLHSLFENPLVGMTSVDSFFLIFIIYGRFMIKKNESLNILKN